jgi:predicted MFS family arabinose efflux permease
MSRPTAEPAPRAIEAAPLPRMTVWLMALTSAVIVANIYYIQPLLEVIAHEFGLTVARAGTLAMLSQIGTALGMLFFVPLGDKFERRSLIIVLVIGDIVSLTLMALAPTALLLGAAAFLVGGFSANVHVVVPFAAHLASPAQRGRVVGTVVAGILFGVLLARTFSGTVGAWLGWRAVYGLAAGAMLVLAAVVRVQLPTSRAETKITWRELMRSTFALVRRHALLRESALLGALLFAGFSAFWTTLVFFLSEPPYRFTNPSAATGLFGLVGALGALAAPSVGHLADKHGPRFTIRIALWCTFLSFVLMGFEGKHLGGLIAGVILMDLGVQSGHVSNQTRIYAIDPAARSRLNTVYMFCYFVGGGLGSLAGALCWHWAGWWGVCGVGDASILLALAVEFLHVRFARESLA